MIWFLFRKATLTTFIALIEALGKSPWRPFSCQVGLKALGIDFSGAQENLVSFRKPNDLSTVFDKSRYGREEEWSVTPSPFVVG